MLLLAIAAFLVVSVIIGVVGGLVGPVLFFYRTINRSWRFQRLWMRVLAWVVLESLALLFYPLLCLAFWLPGSCIITYNFLRRVM